MELDNGMKLVVKKLPINAVYAKLFVDCGSIYENRGNNGVSHFLEHMVGEDGQIKDRRLRPVYRIERTGDDLNAWTGQRFTEYDLYSSLDFWRHNLRLFLDMIAAPVFSEKNLKKERRAIIREIEDIDSQSNDFDKEALKRMFRGHPISFPIIGRKKTVLNFSSRKIRNWHKRFYQPQRTLLLVAGAVDINDILIIVKRSKYFSLVNRDKVKAVPEVCCNPQPNMIIGDLAINKSAIIFPLNFYLSDLDKFYADIVLDILQDQAASSIRWNTERELGLYGAVTVEKNFQVYPFIKINIMSPSHKILKKLEKDFLRWIKKTAEHGSSKDAFTRFRNRKIRQMECRCKNRPCADLRKIDFNSGNELTKIGFWWVEFLAGAIIGNTLESIELNLQPRHIEKRELERVFNECLGGEYKIFRSFNKKPRDDEE
ncbi:MAG: pitrilysin family protein [bacterium]